jgi:exopolysaccharide production protein ExoQ
MKPEIAAVCFACGILGLFLLDRDPKARISFALWIPVIWLSIAGSRVVSEWLNPSGPSLANPYVEGNAVDRNVQTVLLVLALIVLVNRGGKVGRLLRANGPILVFFLYCGVSALWSDFPDVSFRRWIKAIGDLVMVLVVLTDPDRSAAFKIPARVGFLLIPLSILLMRYYPYLARGFDDITGVPTYTGVTTSKNSLGMICMVFGLGSVWRFLEAYRSRERTRRTQRLIAHGAVIAMVLWLLLGAHSMTSLSCFALAIGLMLATSSPTLARKPSVVHLLVAAVVCVSFSVLFLNVGGGVL